MKEHLGNVCQFIDTNDIELVIGLVVYDSQNNIFRIVNLETHEVSDCSNLKFIKELGELRILASDNTKIYLNKHCEWDEG